MPDGIAYVLAAAFGLTIGSFLNVCIHRLPGGQSIMRPASHCPACGHALAWHENLPVVSYVALGGRCRSCRAGISVRYPSVELATALTFVGAYALCGPGLLLVSRLIFASAMIALFAIDLEHRLLPNAITLPGIGVGFLFSLLGPPGWFSSLVGIAAGGGVLLAIAEAYYRIRGEEGLGMGDVKMLAMIGAFLGWELMLITLILASFLGSLVGVAVIVSGKGGLKYALPFGTFLALGGLAASAAGDAILQWYLGFY